MEDRQLPRNGISKRASTACDRCRRQKIKCTGGIPCNRCSVRDTACTFIDSMKKVLVTQGYLQQLQRNVHNQLPNQALGDDGVAVSNPVQTSTLSQHRVPTADNDRTPPQGAGRPVQQANASVANDYSRSTSPGSRLVNPLAIDSENYIIDEYGTPIHLGTSSNWSFGRRVLRRACERLGRRIPTDQLHFEGSLYDIDWKSISLGSMVSHGKMLPAPDHAIYLINAVKFRCGQMFHLLEEDDFMQHFSRFHSTVGGPEHVPSIWYTHYLIVIALGKALVARSSQRSGPPGVVLFLEAFKKWPELVIGRTDTAECIETLVCIAVYLQCLDFRNAAYNVIGQATRRCFELGFHTRMSYHASQTAIVQRARSIWWTVYMLDRQMGALMGVPQTIRDEDVSAPLPDLDNGQKAIAMEVHVKLSRAIAEILNTVYSTEGRLPKKFLQSTRRALQNIAAVTDLLRQHTDLPAGRLSSGISRLGAYLHLLNHQCICLATRPVAFSLLDLRLQGTAQSAEKVTGSALVLLRLCVDSAQRMLLILSGLEEQDMLESFLPFDLGAVFVAAIIIIMAHTIEPRLVENSQTWLDMAHSILNEISQHGNRIAVMYQREICHLADVLGTGSQSENQPPVDVSSCVDNLMPATRNSTIIDSAADFGLFEQPFWHDHMTADQLITVANSLDLDGFDWLTTLMDDSQT